MSKRKLPNNEILYDLYVNQKKTTREIADMYNLKSISNIHIQLKKMGVETRKCKGENHHQWKGGKISKGWGYTGVWKPDHERADHQGYVYEHTLVYEKTYGILPDKGEVIHHIDLNKKNNKPNNLVLCNHKQHMTIHRKLESLIGPLIEKGFIEFDKENLIYKIKG